MPNAHKNPTGDLCLLHVTFMPFFHLLWVWGMVSTDHTDSSIVGHCYTVDHLPASLGNSFVGACEDMAPDCHIGGLDVGRLGPRLDPFMVLAGNLVGVAAAFLPCNHIAFCMNLGQSYVSRGMLPCSGIAFHDSHGEAYNCDPFVDPQGFLVPRCYFVMHHTDFCHICGIFLASELVEYCGGYLTLPLDLVGSALPIMCGALPPIHMLDCNLCS